MNQKHRRERFRKTLFKAFFFTATVFIIIMAILLQLSNASAVFSPPKEYIPDSAEVTMLAKLIYGEARGIESQAEQAAVVWCVLNRVDSTGYGMGHSVKYVVTFKGQFLGYSSKHPTVDDFGRDLKVLAADVLTRWATDGEGRVLPKEYLWFSGKAGHNVFRDAYKRSQANIWDWVLDSPYENQITIKEEK